LKWLPHGGICRGLFLLHCEARRDALLLALRASSALLFPLTKNIKFKMKSTSSYAY
jgi:hypothetical protein